MNKRQIYWLLALIVGSCSIMAQTNVTTLDPELFPRGKEAIWLALIPPITFTITWIVGKIPPLPKELLPWITPVVGVLVGTGLDWATKADWPWWSSAGAGAISVALYEAMKGITKASQESTLTPTPKPEKVEAT
jgi:hypothetical protein